MNAGLPCMLLRGWLLLMEFRMPSIMVQLEKNAVAPAARIRVTMVFI